MTRKTFKDIGDFAQNLIPILQLIKIDPALISKILDLQDALFDPEFIILNKYYSSNIQGAKKLNKSNGLSLVLPSNISYDDNFSSIGNGSFSSYEENLYDDVWTEFLKNMNFDNNLVLLLIREIIQFKSI